MKETRRNAVHIKPTHEKRENKLGFHILSVFILCIFSFLQSTLSRCGGWPWETKIKLPPANKTISVNCIMASVVPLQMKQNWSSLSL